MKLESMWGFVTTHIAGKRQKRCSNKHTKLAGVRKVTSRQGSLNGITRYIAVKHPEDCLKVVTIISSAGWKVFQKHLNKKKKKKIIRIIVNNNNNSKEATGLEMINDNSFNRKTDSIITDNQDHHK